MTSAVPIISFMSLCTNHKLRRGPTQEEILADGDFHLSELPSDEAWFGTPDPAIYTQGTNHLTKQQLAGEVEKGNVVTLRQLKQHLETATPEQLQVSSTFCKRPACMQQ